MEKIFSLIEIHEWDDKADRGEVVEPPFTPFYPSTGISCPAIINDRGDRCGAHMCDWFGYFYRKGKKKKRIMCSVCHYWDERNAAPAKLNGAHKKGLE